MPHIPVHPSAEKRQRQNLKRAERNRVIKSRVRSAVKEAAQAIAGSDTAVASEKLRVAAKTLQKAASKGTMHRNTVRRQISRLSSRLHKASAKSSS